MHLWFSTRLRKEITKWTGLGKPSKGTSHTSCLWECQLELGTVLLRMCLTSLSPLDFQKKPCRVYWNLWRALLTHQPNTWSGSRPWQRNLQKSYILPFDLMSSRSGHRAVGVEWGSTALWFFKAIGSGWESKMEYLPQEVYNVVRICILCAQSNLWGWLTWGNLESVKWAQRTHTNIFFLRGKHAFPEIQPTVRIGHISEHWSDRSLFLMVPPVLEWQRKLVLYLQTLVSGLLIPPLHLFLEGDLLSSLPHFRWGTQLFRMTLVTTGEQ